MAKEKTNEISIEEIEKKNNLNIKTTTDLSSISSGSYTIDAATNINGYKRGTVIEIFGPESCGKSTIVLHAIAEHQKVITDKKVVLIDYEYSFDASYARSVGVDINNLLVYQPNSMEQGYDMIIDLAKSGLCSLIVIDSHTAAPPQKILEGEMSDVTMGLQARNNSKFLMMIKGVLSKTQTTLIGVSQTRSNIGSMGGGDIPTGGNAWKFYSDMRFKVWKSLDKEKGLNCTTLDVVKNKCATPWGKAEFDIVWGEGIDTIQEIVNMAVDKKIVEKSGSWYSYNGTKLGQGFNNVKILLDDNIELFNEIKEKVLS